MTTVSLIIYTCNRAETSGRLNWLKCCRMAPAIAAFQAQLNRRRLRRVSGPLVRLKFSKFFGSAPPQEIQDLLAMG